MPRRAMITERGGWGVYFSLLLFSGLSLIFSMPWATYVKKLLASPWQPSPLVIAYVAALSVAFGAARLIGDKAGSIITSASSGSGAAW